MQDAANAVAQNGDVDVDQQSHFQTGHLQVGFHLRDVHRQYVFYGLDLDDDCFLHQ